MGTHRSLGYGIQHPDKWFDTRGPGLDNWDWCNVTYDNLWSAENNQQTSNDNLVVKTIYDPCPVGFHVPAPNAFTGFTTTGQSEYASASRINNVGNWDNGYHFKANDGSSNTVYFPITRRRVGGDALSVGDDRGYYFSAGPSSRAQIWYCRINDFYVEPLCNDISYNFRAHAMSVRPVAE